jgi:hypothetical protein
MTHAGLANTEVGVYPYEGMPPPGVPSAAFFAPGAVVMGEEARPLSPSQHRDANEQFDKPRILVHVAPEEPVVAAKLRHELEHVVQWLTATDGRKMFILYDAVVAALEAFVGEDRRGSAVLYNVVPFEADANAAAYAFACESLSASEVRRFATGDHGVLFRPGPWHPDVTTVAERSVCAASLAPERTNDFLESNGGAERLITSVIGDAALWPRLCSNAELRTLADDARRLAPSHDQVDAAAPDYAAAWRRLRAVLLQAINAAIEIAG